MILKATGRRQPDRIERKGSVQTRNGEGRVEAPLASQSVDQAAPILQ
jgi:hypothetical protein